MAENFINFGRFEILDDVIRHTIGIISVIFFLIFLLGVVLTFKRYKENTSWKEKAVLVLSVISLLSWAVYELIMKKGIFWEAAIVVKVLQMLIISQLLLDSSVPDPYTEEKAQKIKLVFIIIFIVYVVVQAVLLPLFHLAFEPMECAAISRLIVSGNTIIITNVYLGMSLYLCQQAEKIENTMRSTILLQSVNENGGEEIKNISSTKHDKIRSLIKTFVLILYIDLIVFVGIEVLLGINANHNGMCCLYVKVEDRMFFGLAAIPLGVLVLNFLLRESTIFYIFFLSVTKDQKASVNIEATVQDRRETRYIDIKRQESIANSPPKKRG